MSRRIIEKWAGPVITAIMLLTLAVSAAGGEGGAWADPNETTPDAETGWAVWAVEAIHQVDPTHRAGVLVESSLAFTRRGAIRQYLENHGGDGTWKQQRQSGQARLRRGTLVLRPAR